MRARMLATAPPATSACAFDARGKKEDVAARRDVGQDVAAGYHSPIIETIQAEPVLTPPPTARGERSSGSGRRLELLRSSPTGVAGPRVQVNLIRSRGSVVDDVNAGCACDLVAK